MKKFLVKLTLPKLVLLAVLIALGLVIGRFSIGTLSWRVSLTFLVHVLQGALSGGLWTGLAMVVSDVISSLFMSTAGYFPGFTLSALIVGILYGLFFYKKPLSVKRWQDWFYTLVAVTVVMLVESVFLNSLWVSMLGHIPFTVAMIPRLALLWQIPVRTVLIMIVLPLLSNIPAFKKLL